LTSRITAESCFDEASEVLDGVVVTEDGCDFAFDGLATFLQSLDGVVEPAVDFATSVVVFVSPSICVLLPISSMLAHFCSEDEWESDVKLAKLLLRFRLVLVIGRPATCDETFGNVFGVEQRS